MKSSNKIWIYGIVFMFIIGMAFAVTSTISSFTGQSNPFNITFNGNQNQSFILPIPQYGYVTNVSLNLYNYNYNYGHLFQENPNQNITGINSNTVYVNYTKPSKYFNATWLVVYNESKVYQNLSFPYNCTNLTSNKLQLKFDSGSAVASSSLNFYCYDSIGWNNLLSYSLSHGGDGSLGGDSVLNTIDANYSTRSGFITAYGTNRWFSEGAGYASYIYEEGINWVLNSSNISIYINNIKTIETTLNFNSSKNISLNISLINSLLASNQPINLTFHSDTAGILQVNLTNATYHYGIDNCSNSFGIPSNGTALNVSFYDTTTNALTNVNISTTIVYDAVTYYTSHNSVNNDLYCVYPAWANISTTTQIRYATSDGQVYYYNNPIYLSNSTLQLPLYLSLGASQTTFTLKDKNTNRVLEDVLCTSYIQIAGSYQAVESKLSDITGNIIFNFLPFNNYKYLCSKAGYNNQLFYLLPPSAAAYTVPMSPTTALNFTFDYDRISLTYSKGAFYNGNNNFTFIIGSLGELQDYGFVLRYPGGTVNMSGTNSNGEQLSTNFTIVGATVTDLLYFDYWYTKVGIGRKDFYPTFSIAVPVTNYTMLANKDKTYGLGLIERVLVSLFCTIIVVGLATLIGQPLMGFALGLIVLSFLIYLGFFPIWAGIISLIFGGIFIFSRVEY